MVPSVATDRLPPTLGSSGASSLGEQVSANGSKVIGDFGDFCQFRSHFAALIMEKQLL